MNIQPGWKWLKGVVDALGLEGQAIQRLVIECDCDGVPQIYVKYIATQEDGERLTEALVNADGQPGVQVVADVVVSDKGEVRVNRSGV